MFGDIRVKIDKKSNNKYQGVSLSSNLQSQSEVLFSYEFKM